MTTAAVDAVADAIVATVLQRQRLRARDVAQKLEAEKQAALAELAAQEEVMKKAKTDKKAARAAAPKRDDLVVFAFRLPKADRDLIHAAAGPGGASRFSVAAILAAANADKKAFEGLAEQARANRK